jgi:hypothetical protein
LHKCLTNASIGATIYADGENKVRDLYEIMMQAQGGQAMANMAQMFGITEDQAKAAMQATLPAFSMGLQQNTDNADYLSQFLGALGSGQHASYFDDAAAFTNPAMQQDGEGILGYLFGSKDVSRMVADQAAEATGLGANIIKQMLPLIASMIMGSLFRQSQGSGMQDFIQDIIRNMTGGAASPQAPAPAPQQQQPSGSDNPFGDILRDILGGQFGGGSSSSGSSSRSGSGMPQMPQLPQTGADFFGAMFQPGIDATRRVQESQLSAMNDMIRSNKKSRGSGGRQK